MISSSKKLFYAAEAVAYIAYNAAARPVSSKEIAAKQSLPPRYLEQMMQKLVRAGILRGLRGPRGGYLLARERRRISLADICEVLGKDESDTPQAGTPLGKTTLRPIWQSLEKKMMEELKLVTIADLCEQATQSGVKKADNSKSDFNI